MEYLGHTLHEIAALWRESLKLAVLAQQEPEAAS